MKRKRVRRRDRKKVENATPQDIIQQAGRSRVTCPACSRATLCWACKNGLR